MRTLLKLLLSPLLAATTSLSAVQMGGSYAPPVQKITIAGQTVKLAEWYGSVPTSSSGGFYLPWWFSLSASITTTNVVAFPSVYIDSFQRNFVVTNTIKKVQVSANVLSARKPEKITYSINDPTRASLTGTTIQGKAPGTVVFTASSESITNSLSYADLFSSTSNQLSYAVQTNSLWYAIFQEGSNLVAGIDPLDNNLFSSPNAYANGGLDYEGQQTLFGYNPATEPPQPYVRNTNCPYAGIDTSWMSAWNSYNGNLRAGTLITPRHILFVNHFWASLDFSMPVGTEFHFVTMDGRLITRTMVNKIDYNGADHPEDAPPSIQPFVWSYITDISVGLLDSPISANDITPIGFLTPGITNHLPTLEGLPILFFDQERRVQVAVGTGSGSLGELSWSDKKTGFDYSAGVEGWPTRYTFSALRYPPGSGDSGFPCFLVYQNTPYLIGCNVTSIYASGLSHPAIRDILKSSVAQLDPAYTITETALNTAPYKLEK